MRNILSIIFIFVATQGFADTKKYEDYQCNDMSNVIDYLLSTTPNIWSKLEQNPKNEKLAIELSWTLDLAANYSTIYKAFCRDLTFIFAESEKPKSITQVIVSPS